MKRYTKIIVMMPWLICGLGAMFYAYEYFLRITPSVMAADLLRFYHMHNGSLGNLSAYYYYIYTPMQLVAGLLMDRYGPRRLLTIATLCCVAGSILFAATQLLWVAEMGRFFIGFGSAFAFVGVLKLATIWLPRRHFAMFAGLTTSLGMLGAIGGDITLTKMVHSLGWQLTTYISASLGIILAVLIGLFMRDENSLERKGETTINTVSYTEAFNGLWKILKTPQMWVIGIIGGAFFMPLSAFAEMWGIPYLENVHRLNHEAAAIGVSLIFAGWAIGGPVYGWFSDKIGQRNLPLAITGISAALAMTVILYLPLTHVVFLYSLLFLLGVCASGESIVFAVGRELGPARLAGSSVAFTNMVVMLSGVVLQPLIGYLLDYGWNGKMHDGLQLFTVANYQWALVAIPAALLIGGLLAQFSLKETYCQQKLPDTVKEENKVPLEEEYSY